MEHNWAHVKHFNVNKAAGSGDTSSRRIRSGQRLMCKVREVKYGTVIESIKNNKIHMDAH